MSLILIILLVLLLGGGLGTGGYGAGLGANGLLGTILLIVVILALLGRI